MRLLPVALALQACWLSDPEIGSKFLDTGAPEPAEPTDKAGDADADLDADTDADADADTDADTDSDTVPVDPFACAEADLGSSAGNNVVVGDTTGAGDDSVPWCYGHGQIGGLDRAYRWTPPSTGCWELDTAGAAFDSVLYVLDQCGGAELGCNDDVDLAYGVSTSDLGVELTGGVPVLLVVDGYDATAFGTFTLDIIATNAITPDVTIGSSMATSGSSAGQDDTEDPALCPYGSSRDVFVEWTAPADGVFRFDLTGSDFDTVLALQSPCTADPIACADGFGDGGEVLDAWYVAGETVLVRIAGWNGATGTWVLGITQIY